MSHVSASFEVCRNRGVSECVVAGDMNCEFSPGQCVSSMIEGVPEPLQADIKEECGKVGTTAAWLPAAWPPAVWLAAV